MVSQNLSFEQREGLEPLPTQLQRGQISPELRAKLWAYVYSLLHGQFDGIYGGYGQWYEILKDVHVNRDFRRLDQFRGTEAISRLGMIFETGPYSAVYGWLDYVIKHQKRPGDFATRVSRILVEGRSAYRVIGGVITPLTSEEERKAYEKALLETTNDKFSGARTHLQQAGSALTNGRFADSIRESISAVESVSRVLEPSGEFSKALARLGSKISIHPALKRGFSAIYGYTSDEGGIRHALLDAEQAAVDEVDAIFFLGACSSFVSYLIGKSRNAGLV